ncbi:MAG: hypothetical protein RL217_498 [Pseudomonadota bacterium]|jgi:predicted metal-dependent hydrolase
MNTRSLQRQVLTLRLGQEDVLVHLQVQKRKSLRLSLNLKAEIELRIPYGTPKVQVLAFVQQHSAWLQEKRVSLQAQQQRPLTEILFKGRTLNVEESAFNEVLFSQQILWIPQGLGALSAKKLIEQQLKQMALHDYEQMISRWWPKFASYAKMRPILRVKKMRSRWGSLSLRGTINLNLNLIQLPETLLELVVVHELCHLKHFDHGAGFKAMMQECLPDWLEREAQLKALAPKLLPH